MFAVPATNATAVSSARLAGLARPLALVVALAALAGRPVLAEETGPDGHTQPLVDGCQRSQSLQVGRATPEWVYVGRAEVTRRRLAGDPLRGTRTVKGVVVESHAAGEDLYLNHDYHDQNVYVLPDPGYEGLVARGQRELEGELEASNIPLWAMPTPGDRVVMSGSWVWDCGHWGNPAGDPTGLSQLLVYDPVATAQDVVAPGAIRGEQTELHPFHELATFRANAAGRLGRRPATVLSRLDVWINGDGGGALAEAECALLGIQVTPVTEAACSEVRDVGGTYRYVIPLGPRPAPGSRIVVDPVAVSRDSHPAVRTTPVRLRTNRAAGTVTVSFTLPHSTRARPFGFTVEAGWTGATPAVRHHVTLERIHIAGSLDGENEPHANPGNVRGEQTADPGEWVLYADVSGRWVKLPVGEVLGGQTIRIGRTIDLWLPPGVSPTLFVGGHECDEPIITCTDERFGAEPDPANPSTEVGFNDRPGRIELMNAGVPMTPGRAVYAPMTNPAGAGNEDLSDAVCGPRGCYQLTATWRRA